MLVLLQFCSEKHVVASFWCVNVLVGETLTRRICRIIAVYLEVYISLCMSVCLCVCAAEDMQKQKWVLVREDKQTNFIRREFFTKSKP